MQKQTLSLRDIAALANTSTATVSRVLAGRAGVSAPLRDRVLAAAGQFQFTPNPSASALARKRFAPTGFTHRAIAVALLAAQETTLARLWDETYEGVLHAAHDQELGVSLCLVRREEIAGNPLPPALMRIPCDGILVNQIPDFPYAALARLAPIVLLGGCPEPDSPFPQVAADNDMGIAGLVAHLAALGHRRLAFLPSDLSTPSFARRAAAFETEMRKRALHGVVAEPLGDHPERYAAAFAARPRAERPTALLVSSDGPAVDLLHALLAAGIRVPEEVSVTGFDGRTWGQSSVPPLTSWHVDWLELGRQAVRLLADTVAGHAGSTRMLIGGSLQVRASTGAPPS